MAYVGLAGCPDPAGPGTGGGGYFPEPAAPEPADTCNTGDPIVDSPGVEQGFAGLWAASSPDSVMEKRHERGGWIVPDGAGGFSIQPFSVLGSNACEIIADTSTQPRNAVSFVHTHRMSQAFQFAFVRGKSSWDAWFTSVTRTSRAITTESRRGTSDFPGYIIDYDKITGFEHDPTSPWNYRIVNQNARCGY